MFDNINTKKWEIGEEFKMKFRGQKIKCRIMGPEEKIHERCIFSWPTYTFTNMHPSKITYDRTLNNLTDPKRLDWHHSEAYDDKVKEHSNRVYVEVLSPWFQF